MTFSETIRFLIDQATRFISPEAVAAEWAILLAAVLVVLFLPVCRGKWFRALPGRFRRIARRKRLALLFCAVLPVVIRLSLLGITPVPDPSIHDEFSHLLLGDTLAHGRLTNPTHPMWRHFESIHIIQKPTYTSMYPPGQGAFLALGQVLFGSPWAGVLISVALMFAAVCWMMQGWLPAEWALFGTLLAMLKFGLSGLWIDSYMGGSVGAIGGALLIGSLPRLRRGEALPRNAFLFGLGIVTLLNTRPFEGGVLSAAAALYLLPALLRRFRKHGFPALRPIVIPAAAVVCCGIAFTGYYSWRVTGSPLRMPYQVNRDTYGWPENLAFLPPKRLHLDDKVLAKMYRNEVEHHQRYNSWDRILDSLGVRWFDVWSFFLGPLLTFPVLLVPWFYRHERSRPLLLFLALIAGLNLAQMVLYPYHLAPVVPVIFALIASAMRYAYVVLSRSAAGRGVRLALILPLSVVLVQAMKNPAAHLNLPLAYWERASEGHRDDRAAIEAWLEAHPRKQLVIVRYNDTHSPDEEWVYNHADIDGSKIVWARERDRASDQRLLQYFSDRQAWLLEADVFPRRVVPYKLPPEGEWMAASSPLTTPWTASVTPDHALPEYPRPQLVRTKWINLNGLWDYAISRRSEAVPPRFDGKLLVPFAIESALSGVKHALTPEDRLWYHRSFDYTPGKDTRLLLHFGAVDWQAEVWVNGRRIGIHEGGYDPFTFDVTDALKPGTAQEVVVAVWDPTDTALNPRGKQVLRPNGIWYTAVSGIWQAVWAEAVPAAHVEELLMVPDPDAQRLRLTVRSGARVPFTATARYHGVAAGTASGSTNEEISIPIAGPHLWDPEHPDLYDLEVALAGGDRVQSYFAMRTVESRADAAGHRRIFLNHRPLFLIGPLDQGWWPDGLYTAPTDDALRSDIDAMKRMGFNMVRKHVKVEPARWYYWCDRLGLLVWQDMPSAMTGPRSFVQGGAAADANFPPDRAAGWEREWKAIVTSLINHPSIIAWAPFNEGWGQHATNDVLKLTKSLDPYRLVDGPSGWQDRGQGDLKDMHAYPGPDMFPLMADRVSVLGEFGGLGVAVPGHLWSDREASRTMPRWSRRTNN